MKKTFNTSSPLFLSFHLFTLIPSILFMIVYAKFSLFSLVMVMILTVLFGYNLYRYKQKLSPLYRPVLLSFVGSFLLYGFTALGSNNTPKTFDMFNAKESVTLLHLKKASPIDKLCYYVGIDYNSFDLEYKSGTQWKNFYHYKLDYPFSFQWKCHNTNIAQTDTILLRPVEHERLRWSTDNDLMLGEIRLYYKNTLLPYNTNVSHLNDEPNTIIDKTYYGGMFFDEIYHGRTAYEISHDLPIYENTHPYLGKHIIAWGTKLFGMSPFGWRFTNVIFGALFIFIAYYFGRILFREEIWGFTSALLMTYSFMHLTQARIALIDTFGVLFVFSAFYYLYRFITEQRLSMLLWSGVFYGLAISIKWSAVFAALGFLFIAAYLLLTRYPLQKRFAGLNLVKYGLVAYALIALSIYFLSFFDIYMHTGSFMSIIHYNTNMYDYHSHLIASHPYSSPWWTWPFDWKPMGYYKQYHGTLVSSINAFGNPAIFWVGILALSYLIFAMFKHKSLQASFILLAFLGLYVPYIFIGRLMFLYHFYYAVPFVILAVVYLLKELATRFQRLGYAVVFYCAIVVLFFLLFYPVLSGVEVEKDFVQHYLIWLPKWWL